MNKNAVMLMLWCFGLFSACSTEFEDTDVTAPMDNTYVNAPGGLRMRSKPQLESSRIMTIPDGSKVNVLKKNNDGEVIDGKFGFWTLVEFDKQSGWVFGAYLSDTAPEAATQELVGKVAWVAGHSDSGPNNAPFRIKFEDRNRFSGYCEGYTIFGNISGKWNREATDTISLIGSASFQTCADGPPLEDESQRCGTASRRFHGTIRIKNLNGMLKIQEYIDLDASNEASKNRTPCEATVKNGHYDHL